MAVKPGLQTIDDLLALPDDSKRYELHDGVIVEVGTSGAKHVAIVVFLIATLFDYVRRENLGGRVTGETGTYKLDGRNLRAPDTAYFSAQKAKLVTPNTVFFPFAPDLAIEVRSPSQSKKEMRDLAALYLRAGTRLVWTFDLEAKTVQVYRTGHAQFEVGRDGELDGYDVLPRFHLKVADVFAEIEK
jgi:Uma2 family endonuclease